MRATKSVSLIAVANKAARTVYDAYGIATEA